MFDEALSLFEFPETPESMARQRAADEAFLLPLIGPIGFEHYRLGPITIHLPRLGCSLLATLPNKAHELSKREIEARIIHAFVGQRWMIGDRYAPRRTLTLHDVEDDEVATPGHSSTMAPFAEAIDKGFNGIHSDVVTWVKQHEVGYWPIAELMQPAPNVPLNQERHGTDFLDHWLLVFEMTDFPGEDEDADAARS